MKRATREAKSAEFVTLAGALAFTLSACSPEQPAPAKDSPHAQGGMGSMAATTDVAITPDSSGWADMTTNDLGVQGSWYPYGDQYGVAKCLNVGLHTPDECSHITSPLPPPAMGFPNQDGKLCTTGATAVILACKTGVTTSGCPDHDYSNMWGAGIGFNFNETAGTDGGMGAKNPWNPDDHGVTGISFELDGVPVPGLRVEFPMRLLDSEASSVNLPPGSTTDDHPDGAPYWGADTAFDNSPAVKGANVVRWDAVKKPGTAQTYVFDKARMLGVQFHVPAVKMAPPGDYAFCVSHFTLLRE
jgi:hypothetical protein